MVQPIFRPFFVRPFLAGILFTIASAAATARTAAALALYLKGQKEVAELKAKLKLAQSKTLAAGTLYQRAIVAEETERVAALAPAIVPRPSKKTPPKTAKTAAVSAKVAVCRPFVPVKRGGANRRLL